MKKFLILFLICPFILSAQTPETYFILHVKGNIEQVSSGDLVKPRTKLAATDQLKFIDDDAVAAAISPSKGRFYIKKDEAGEGEEEWVAIVKDVILPASSRASTRAGSLLNIQDFEKLFAKEFLITDNVKLHVPASSFPQTENKFFYLQYVYGGEKINKKLPYDGEWLIFDRSTILNIDGKPVAEEQANDFTLYYYDAGKELSTRVSSLNPVFVEKKVILDIIHSVAPYYDSQEDQESEIREVLKELYGYISPGSFKQWLTENR